MAPKQKGLMAKQKKQNYGLGFLCLPGMDASCQLTLAKLPPAGGSPASRPTSAHHPQGDTSNRTYANMRKAQVQATQQRRVRNR